MSYPRSGFAAPFLLAAAAALAVGGQAVAQPAPSAAPAAAAPSPFLGEWELDLARMPGDYGPPPKRVTFTFEDAGSGAWRTTVAITAPDDSVRRAIVRYRRDGRAVPAEGDMAEGDSAAFSAPAPNVLVMAIAKDQALVGVRVYAISADGTEMTESASGVHDDGAPFVREFHFRRIR